MTGMQVFAKNKAGRNVSSNMLLYKNNIFVSYNNISAQKSTKVY